MALRSFRGGVHPHEHKELSEHKPLEVMPVPPEIFLPLGQHLGKPAEPRVKKGDYVRPGQVVAASAGPISAPIHSPVAGTVKRIVKGHVAGGTHGGSRRHRSRRTAGARRGRGARRDLRDVAAAAGSSHCRRPGDHRTRARGRHRGPGRRGVPHGGEAEPAPGQDDRLADHQRRRVRALPDARLPADARARRGAGRGHRVAGPSPGPPGGGGPRREAGHRHREQQARGHREVAGRRLPPRARRSRSSNCAPSIRKAPRRC